jgi:hypothetical protein
MCTVTMSKQLCLLLLLSGCEGGGPGVETLLSPGSAQINLTVTAGPACPAPVITPVLSKR